MSESSTSPEPKRPRQTASLVFRFVRATVAVAVASALLLAGAAALIAWVLWEAGEKRDFHARTSALVAKIERDVEEADWKLTEDVPEAVSDRNLAGYRLEVWRGAALIASNHSGPLLGPPSDGAARRPTLSMTATRLPHGLELLAAVPRVHVRRALGVFAWSLALATPLCLGVALVAGRVVAVRAARPLLDLGARIRAARLPGPLAPPAREDDVAEVAEIEMALRGLWVRLQDALAREKDFATNASHELRTPLTRIRLYNESAAALAGPRAGSELAEQRREIDRMARSVDSLLLLSREICQEGGSETVNLADVLRDAASHVFTNPSDVEVAAPDEALVRGNEQLLQIAALNLLDNARKFKRAGSRARLELTEARGWLSLVVTSPGAHVAAAERERVFERFYRGLEARSGQEGHGLGLALVRHIVRLHGGEAACTSAPEQDARFELRIPAWRQHGASAGPPA